MNSNQTKNALLGEPYGTATNRLRKMLLFDFARQLGKDFCYRCENQITEIRDFSIEHTIAWQGTENPRETFFDITKIAFSHLSCNARAGLRPHKKYENIQENWREAAKRKYADPIAYEKHLARKRKQIASI